MASIGELSVVIRADDQFTPTLKKVNTSLRTNMAAVRQLGYGVTYLGTSFMAMGFALKQTNSALGQSVGNTLMMVGAIATAIGQSFQFIAAIGKMVVALRTLATWQIITKALSGPWGWAALAGGVAVAGVTIAATNQKVATSSSKTTPTVNVTVMGSVVTENQLAETIRKKFVIDQQRNSTSGIK